MGTFRYLPSLLGMPVILDPLHAWVRVATLNPWQLDGMGRKKLCTVAALVQHPHPIMFLALAASQSRTGWTVLPAPRTSRAGAG